MPDFPLPDLGNLTATAILGWYAWHTAARTIPSLVEAFRAEMAATRAEFRSDREALREELVAERGQRHADHMAIVQSLHDVARLCGQTDAVPVRSACRFTDRVQEGG